MLNKNKPIALISFIDYTNETVKIGRNIFSKVLKHYGDDIRLSTRFYSQDPDNPAFQISSKAALAAELQGKSIEMRNKLIEQNSYSEESVISLAKSLALDIEQFKIDLHSDIIAERLAEDIKIAEEQGITIVPSLSINGYPYTGAWDGDALIEAIKDAHRKPAEQVMKSFVHWGASAAIVLLTASILALIFVNVGFFEQYEFVRQFQLGINAGDSNFTLSIGTWVNDGLMAIFFLLIGLEIKREIISGELSTLKKAAMPVIGALGGILIPVTIYSIINFNGDGAHGWGVPMATDIAFTLGLMALLGSKVPGALKVFISALAVTDDLGAIVVIALFYGHGFHLSAFIVSIVVIGLMALLNYKKVYSKTVYIILGVILWYFIHESGLHATLAGVITAILIPSRPKGNLIGIASQTNVIFEHEITRIKDADNSQESIRHGALQIINKSIDRLIGPGEQMEFSMEKPVNYFILPLFAFFNTGIVVAGAYFNVFTSINLGIIIGLCIGKPLGIVGFCWIADKLKIASLSSEINWVQLIGAACLAGVGFTMSIVVAASAYEGEILDGAKLSILIASALSAVMGLFILKRGFKLVQK